MSPTSSTRVASTSRFANSHSLVVNTTASLGRPMTTDAPQLSLVSNSQASTELNTPCTPPATEHFMHPIPKVIVASEPLPPGNTTAMDERRYHRYSLAEEALATSFQHCALEPSPKDLQIRALEKATAILRAHAKDAHERAEMLRHSLTDRSAPPQLYQAMKHERWKEERRCHVVEQDVSNAQKLVTALALPERSKSASSPPNDNPRTAEARRSANLSRFLSSSTTKHTISDHGRHPPIHPPISVMLDRSSRRMTTGQISPLRLRTTSITAAFAASLTKSQGHNRSRSLEVHSAAGATKTITKTNLFNPRQGEQDASHCLSVVEEDPPLLDSDADSPFLESSQDSDLPPPNVSLTNSSPTTPVASPRITLELGADHVEMPKNKTTDSNLLTGTAKIYRSNSTPVRGRPHPEFDDIHVTIPQYALDLLSEFDKTPHTPSLLPLRQGRYRPPPQLPTIHSQSEMASPMLPMIPPSISITLSAPDESESSQTCNVPFPSTPRNKQARPLSSTQLVNLLIPSPPLQPYLLSPPNSPPTVAPTSSSTTPTTPKAGKRHSFLRRATSQRTLQHLKVSLPKALSSHSGVSEGSRDEELKRRMGSSSTTMIAVAGEASGERVRDDNHSRNGEDTADSSLVSVHLPDDADEAARMEGEENANDLLLSPTGTTNGKQPGFGRKVRKRISFLLRR